MKKNPILILFFILGNLLVAQVSVSISEMTNVSCFGFSNGSATVNPINGSPPYTYTWSNGATTQTINGLAAGTYTVTVTDNIGETDNTSVIIDQPEALMVSVLIMSSVSCNGGADGSITASAFGGTAPYSYLWSNGDTTATTNNLIAGTYNVTITDANGCSVFSSSSITIIEPAILTVNNLSSNVSCNGANDGSATVSASGGTMPYTYLWSNAATTSSIDNLVAGIYNVTVTDANGCTSTGLSVVSEPEPLRAFVDLGNIACRGDNGGMIRSFPTGGTPPYTFLWSTGTGTTTSSIIDNLVAGEYSLTVTDANGCTDISINTITEPDNFITVSTIINRNASTNDSSDGTATATASQGNEPYTYSWSNGATTATITGVPAGTYTVSVTDASGCGPITAVATVGVGQTLSTSSNNLIDVSLYPNPVNDVMTLNFDTIITNGSIEIVNIQGKIVSNTPINAKEMTLNLSQLRTGVYFLKVASNKSTNVYRVVKL